jgi:hypothetical protein
MILSNNYYNAYDVKKKGRKKEEEEEEEEEEKKERGSIRIEISSDID